MIKQKWGKLTDDDLKKAEGNAEELSGLIQKKYGMAKDEVEKNIEDLVKKSKNETGDKSKH